MFLHRGFRFLQACVAANAGRGFVFSGQLYLTIIGNFQDNKKIMFKFAFTFLSLVFCTVLFSQPKKPITHESMWMLKRVGAPEISPDGKWVVFNVTEPSYNEKEIVNDLWMYPRMAAANQDD